MKDLVNSEAFCTYLLRGKIVSWVAKHCRRAILPLRGVRGVLYEYRQKDSIMSRNKIIPYRADLKDRARELRKNSTLSEVLLWKHLKNQALGYQFHRQVPLADYIVDFYCHELHLAIEIDGSSHEGKYLYDAHRHVRLETLGVHLLHIDDLEVKRDIQNVLALIVREIEAIQTIC